MSGSYCGLVIGVSKSLSTLFAIFAPNIANFLIPNHSILEWKICFFVFSAILFLGGILFVLFSKGDLEEWAEFKRFTKKTSNIGLRLDNGGSKLETSQQRRNHTRKLIRQFSIDSRSSFVPQFFAVPDGFKEECESFENSGLAFNKRSNTQNNP